MPNCLKIVRDAKMPARAQYTRDPQGKAQPQLTATETWRVIFDGNVTQLAVFDAADPNGNTLPKAGFVYNGLFCGRVNPVRSTASSLVWDVTVDMMNIQSPESQTGNWNINLKQGSAARQEVRTLDGVKKPYFNAAGDILPQLPNADIYDKTVTITWSSSTPPTWSEDVWEGCVNTDPVEFTVCGVHRKYKPFQVKVTGLPMDATRTQVGTDSSGNPINTFTYNNELSIQIRSFIDRNGKERGWVWTAPNEGFKGFDQSDGTTFGTFREQLVSGVVHSTTKNPELAARTDPTKLDPNGEDIVESGNDPVGQGVLILPYDLAPSSGAAPAYTDYNDDGRFVPYDFKAISLLFVGLNDSDQIPHAP